MVGQSEPRLHCRSWHTTRNLGSVLGSHDVAILEAVSVILQRPVRVKKAKRIRIKKFEAKACNNKARHKKWERPSEHLPPTIVCKKRWSSMRRCGSIIGKWWKYWRRREVERPKSLNICRELVTSWTMMLRMILLLPPATRPQPRMPLPGAQHHPCLLSLQWHLSSIY